MKKKITIKGDKVHDVGYRLLLMEMAEDAGIKNFDAKNIKEKNKETIKILIDSEENNINQFIQAVKENHPEQAKIDNIEIEEYEGEIKLFETYERSFMRQQQAKIANAGVGMLSLQYRTLEKLDIMIEKQDQMLEKQDQTISILTDIKENTSQMPVVIKEIQNLKTKYEKIEEEITEIKRAIQLKTKI